MSDAFDPYRKWLGIPPADQPPHHYRLLGIGLFEDDADTIAIAADRQMAHLRTFQTGPHSALSQKLLNELAAARLALLDPKKKAAYDEQLRANLASTVAESSGAGEGSSAPPAPKPQAVPRPQLSPHTSVALTAGQGRGERHAVGVGAPTEFVSPVTPRVRRRRSRRQPAVWVGLGAAALALAGVAYFVYRQTQTEATRVAVHGAPSEAARHAKRTSPDTAPTTDAKLPLNADPDDGQRSRATRIGSNASASDGRPADTEGPHERRTDSGVKLASKPAGDQGLTEPPPQPPSVGDPPEKPKPTSLADLATIAERPQLARARRESPPEGKSLTAAAGRFAQQYGKEIAAAKTPQPRLKVAFKIWNEARDGSQTADLRYVMLDNVGKEALAQGSVGLAYRVTAEVGRQFDVDPLAIRLKALDAAAKNAQSPDACAIGALEALSVADRAAGEGRLDLANKAAGVAGIFARKTKDKELAAQIDRRKAALREQSTRAAAHKKALADLKKTPDDREANLTAGKYELLVLGDWQDGLEKLSASGDERLAEIARLEAMARGDLSQWAPLGIAWWQASQTEADEFFKPLCRSQAKYCYLRAKMARRAGEILPETEQQIKTLPGYPISRLVPGVAARYYDGGDFQRQRVERAESAIDFFYGQGSPDPSVPTNFFSARWTGFIKPPVSGRYQIVTHTNDSVRLWVDGKQVLNRWGQAAGWQKVELDLSDEPHSFHLEYNETFDVAFAMFGWTLAAFPDDQHDQWSPIDALYYDPDSPFDLPEGP